MTLHRRDFIATAIAASAMPGLATARSETIGTRMRERATAFLATLEPAQQAGAQFAFDDPLRRRWNYMLGSRRAPGLPMESMVGEQKEAALDLLDTALSRTGMEKALNVMLQQDILRDEWSKGSPDRNSERFSVMVFGTPSASAPWGWRWEGHHLSLSFTLMGDEVISATPNSFSSEPNTVPSGPHRGLIVLKEEESLARTLFADLRDGNRRLALVNETAPGNVQTHGRDASRYAGDTRGLPLADMTTSQRDMALRLIEVYTSEPFAGALGDQQRRRTAEGDVMGTRFVWAGADLENGPIYYRLHGPTTLIEFASLRNQPLHLHTAVHDTTRNMGAHLL